MADKNSGTVLVTVDGTEIPCKPNSLSFSEGCPSVWHDEITNAERPVYCPVCTSDVR